MIYLITAISKNYVIGKNNKLPWNIKEDLEFFKKMTFDKIVVMGKKTYNSIGMPLLNRKNIVLTHNKKCVINGVEIKHSIEEILKISKEKDVFIIGGESLYSQFLKYSDYIYLTFINKSFEGDTFFPKIDFKKWKMKSIKKAENKEKLDFDYYFIEYKKNDQNQNK